MNSLTCISIFLGKFSNRDVVVELSDLVFYYFVFMCGDCTRSSRPIPWNRHFDVSALPGRRGGEERGGGGGGGIRYKKYDAETVGTTLMIMMDITNIT